MKKFIFDFSVDAWIKGVEIEADTYEEAEEELHRHTLEDLIEKGYVKDSSISNIDCEVEDDEEDDYEDDLFDDDDDELNLLLDDE